jgi:SAM-dependent methyltransferase
MLPTLPAGAALALFLALPALAGAQAPPPESALLEKRLAAAEASKDWAAALEAAAGLEAIVEEEHVEAVYRVARLHAPLSHRPTGVVWAIDIAPEVLEVLEARARQEGLANIGIQRVTPDDPQLPPGGVDTILMVDTLHYIKGPDRGAYAKKLRAALAPGGRVVVIDFVPKPLEERPWGPPPQQKMSREEVDAAMAEAGLVPARVHDFLTEQFFVEYRPQ